MSTLKCGASCKIVTGAAGHPYLHESHRQRVTISGMFKRKLSFLLLAIFCFTVASSAADFTIKKMGDGIYPATANEGGKAGSKAGFVIVSEGGLVVDTLQHAGGARGCLPAIR